MTLQTDTERWNAGTSRFRARSSLEHTWEEKKKVPCKSLLGVSSAYRWGGRAHRGDSPVARMLVAQTTQLVQLNCSSLLLRGFCTCLFDCILARTPVLFKVRNCGLTRSCLPYFFNRLSRYEPTWVHVFVCSEDWLQDAYFQTLIKTQCKLRQFSGNIASTRDGLGGIAWHKQSSNLRMIAWSCQPVIKGYERVVSSLVNVIVPGKQLWNKLTYCPCNTPAGH